MLNLCKMAENSSLMGEKFELFGKISFPKTHKKAILFATYDAFSPTHRRLFSLLYKK